ncbi:MAG: CBS domain-containing protein [Rhodobacterales bacterium]|nr:CBS domain-containing protein [Rhodobacterales bacterium]
MTSHSYPMVRDVMASPVHTIERTATVREAIDILRKTGVSSLMVQRRDKSDEYGLVVVTDIAREVIGPDRAPERVLVYEIMTKPVLTLPDDMNIKYAVRLLTKFYLSRALVLDGGREPVGIVTLRDMVLRVT